MDFIFFIFKCSNKSLHLFWLDLMNKFSGVGLEMDSQLDENETLDLSKDSDDATPLKNTNEVEGPKVNALVKDVVGFNRLEVSKLLSK